MAGKAQIEDLKGQLAQALVRNPEFATRISELEAIVLRLSTVKTSKNSYNPPSKDKWGKKQSLREKSDKPVGGQSGYKGTTLK